MTNDETYNYLHSRLEEWLDQWRKHDGVVADDEMHILLSMAYGLGFEDAKQNNECGK